ncbi:MAG TPA: hypothetical protein VIX89_09605 [Bryobacteraceae bacterium]
MKLNTLPLLLTVFLVGCDGAANKFAQQTHELLNEYRKKINEQISLASKYYTADADIGVNEARRQMNSALAVDRDERSTELAVNYLDGRKPPSSYRTELRAYAQAEYDARKASYQAAIDASLPYVQQLAKLQADKETVDALGKALDALEKKRGLGVEMKDLEGFVNETKKDFSLLVCADLRNQKTKLDAQANTAVGSQKTDLQAQSAAVAKLRTDRKCDDLEKAAAAAAAPAAK